MVGKDLRALERAIVRELLAASRAAPLSCSQLADRLGCNAPALVLRHLLGELHRAAVIEMVGDQVELSTPVQRLALLGMVSAGRARFGDDRRREAPG
ncbi:MAG TPA: hypothetical protein VKU89_00555 [Solirubrobacteraceae bacterium]|nr:hypothetical protein [Solirubrobacteraceae bacterium]